ncbi:MAG: hypothetical protein CL484_04130 [Acidobacteria bacterium]|jgi:hypothetical protein|uniref:hypothetical protein n=1 Tax=Halomonas sp. PA16-9 TaxID=2576841 RepID=UPI000C8BF357|nr:hypothetical protein [Acidobacteriota bacterium]QGQ72648.1 hypothetical protein FDY98_25935 [Halomonas sp. PA16-9]|tara:strand:+ start:3986 stop:4435 length:450 start_codon:yes stop_codon:yes gene_type:complete
MTQDKQSWASSLFKWIGGRSSQPAAAEPVEADSPAVTQATLALARDLLNEEPSVKRFAVKDRVTWKWGMKNKMAPLAQQTAVVMVIRDEPFFDDSQSPSSAYFEEPLDVRVGVFTPEGIFREVWVDGRRLCLVTDTRARKVAGAGEGGR